MPAAPRTFATARAEVPYLRDDVTQVYVKASSRDLGDQIARRELEIRNGRTADPSLEGEGFQLASWPSRTISERQDELIAETLKPHKGATPLQRAYWDETIPLILKLSGARDVIAQDASGVRFSPRSDRKHWLGPAAWAHVDFEAGEIEAMLRLALEREGRPFKPYSRFVMYQGWRALSPPPQDYPLALCDGRTVAANDLVPIDYLQDAGGRDGVVRSWGCRYSPRHQWWFFPDMTLDEMIVFKGFDSTRPDAPCTLHVAFDDKTIDQPVPRTSYESRYFALFD